ncbi:hypothetical protein [Sinomonas humi]|uniref:Uncharacterized protein n=1 Tax=Sinomonas humi TaxID=1338436 RepID=A0A0B2AL47_9MICC|nr:hypothetical protein [Sinomonas humi]KHL04380.1 hypothetical protein LK10_05625 [Sinomonas humi]
MKFAAGLRPLRPGREKWAPTKGAHIQLRQWGQVLRDGVIEDVMPDRAGFWLGADGADSRLFVHLNYDDIEVWVPEGIGRSQRRVA